MNPFPVRVRFAPSPTGPLHLGGVRTALYNYLFAKKYHGTFVLRIEDTDQKRFVPGAEEYIFSALNWCGLIPDESVQTGGPFGPYRQSERTPLYLQYIQTLIDTGNAYYAFDTPSELEKRRRETTEAGEEPFQYNCFSRNSLENSLILPEAEVTKRLERGDPYVIRIRIPEEETIVFSDLIRGEVTVQSAHLDDKVLFKSDGLPTYHFANVVDDHLMQITHVIRGEEWLPSAPLHLLLYRFLGWEKEMPAFAHLPLILKPDGHGKLSKRDGDRLGFPVFPLAWKDPQSDDLFQGYREEGYLPEAFINMLALLGWNSGSDQEMFSITGLIDHFSLDRINKSGARFDPEKAKWFNHQYLQQIPVADLCQILIVFLHDSGQPETANLLKSHLPLTQKIVDLSRNRANLLPDLWHAISFFFQAPVEFDLTLTAKIWKPETAPLIHRFVESIRHIISWDADTIHTHLVAFTEGEGVKMGQLMNPLRLLIVGSNTGPGMTDIAALIGKEEFLRRIDQGLLALTNSH